MYCYEIKEAENERVFGEVVREEKMGSLKMMKGCKAAGVDGIVIEMLKNGGISIMDWLLRIFNKCIESGVVPGRVGRQRVSSGYTKGKVAR